MELLDELQSRGSEQTRKIYTRHGVSNPMYGVSYKDLGQISKRVKRDHAAALELWSSGNHDARVLATMIADPKAIDAGTLDGWANDCENYIESDALAKFAASTPHADAVIETWTTSNKEWVGSAGWGLLAFRAMKDKKVPDEYFEPFIETIENGIHAAKNRVRYSMNGALIAIGLRGGTLQKKALAAAKRIGSVDVDHGQTSCETPDAEAYIRRVQGKRQKAKG